MPFPGLGVGILARLLSQHGMEVTVLDLFIPNIAHLLTKYLETGRPDVVGFSATTTSYDWVADYWRKNRERFPNTRSIIGGPHPTFFPEEVVRDGLFDVVFTGEAENEISEILVALKSKSVRLDGKLPEAKDIPAPDFRYTVGINKRPFFYPVMTSRGCKHRCIHCSNVFGNRRQPLRLRPYKSVLDELLEAKQLYPNILGYIFIDDHLTSDLSYFKQLLEMIAKAKLNRAISVMNLLPAEIDEETVLLLKRAGCYSVGVGIDSGAPEIFPTIGKPGSLEDIIRCCQWFSKHGILIDALYVLGFPGETASSVRNSVAFNSRIRPDFTLWTPLLPLEGTRAQQWFQQNGEVLNTKVQDIDFQSYQPPEASVSTKDFPLKERRQAHFYAILRTAQYRLPMKELPHFFRLAHEMGLTREAIRSVVKKILRPQICMKMKRIICLFLARPSALLDLAKYFLGTGRRKAHGASH